MSAASRPSQPRPTRLAGPPIERRKRPPSFGFIKGAALGVILVVPTVAATVWVLSRLGIGNPSISMVDAIRMAALFAGIAAIVTAGGIGRLAAHASTLAGGRRTALWRAARAQAVASAGLVIIAAIPHGGLPAEPLAWIWIAVAGLISGAGVGALIGLVCGAPPGDRVESLPALMRRVPVIAEMAAAATQQMKEMKAQAKVARTARTAGKSMRLRAVKETPPAGTPAVTPPAEPAAATPTPPTGADVRAAGRAALATEIARAAAPPTRAGLPRADRTIEAAEPSQPADTQAQTETRAPSTDDGGATPLPSPVPLGDEDGVTQTPPPVAPPGPSRTDD